MSDLFVQDPQNPVDCPNESVESEELKVLRRFAEISANLSAIVAWLVNRKLVEWDHRSKHEYLVKWQEELALYEDFIEENGAE